MQRGARASGRRGGRLLCLRPVRRLHLPGGAAPLPPQARRAQRRLGRRPRGAARPRSERGWRRSQRLCLRRRGCAERVDQPVVCARRPARAPQLVLLQRRQRRRDGLPLDRAQPDALLPPGGEGERAARAHLQRRHGPVHQLVRGAELDLASRLHPHPAVAGVDDRRLPPHGRLRHPLRRATRLPHDSRRRSHGARVQAGGRLRLPGGVARRRRVQAVRQELQAPAAQPSPLQHRRAVRRQPPAPRALRPGAGGVTGVCARLGCGTGTQTLGVLV
mmetsp:Transcript_39814/g.118168  ORF Transcript_39814/g.118168 Transcript_39814/m.118168 type:complete len:275 (-) Transcript_39814:639-1463(-)